MSYLYDVEFKNYFLELATENYGDEYVERYKDVFDKVKRTERYNDKDLYDFNSYEVSQFLYSYKSTDVFSMFMISGFIYKYQILALNKHKTNIVPKRFKLEDVKEYLDSFKLNNKYLLLEEYQKLIKNLENAQDKAVIVLLWSGVFGKELVDVLNLKIDNIDFINNQLKYTDALMNEQVLQMQEWETDILRDAINQEKYVAVRFDEEKNTRAILSEEEIEKKLAKKRTKAWGTIITTPYILRKVGKIDESAEGNPFSYAGLRTRFNAIKKMSLEHTISFKSIYDSGVAYRAIKDKVDITSDKALKSYVEEKKLSISYYNLGKGIEIIKNKMKKRDDNEA